MNLGKAVPILALLMILGGVVYFGTEIVVSWKTRSGFIESEKWLETEREVSRQNRLSGLSDGQLDALRKTLARYSAYMDSPADRIIHAFGILLSLVGIGSGIGLLLVKEWARVLAIRQSAVSILFHLWVIWFSPLSMFQDMLTSALHGSPASKLPQTFIHTAWGLLVIWIFTSAPVKTVYQSPGV